MVTAEELINKAIEQRNARRYEEALFSAIAATEAAPDNANAWWQVALNRINLSDYRKAVPALNKVNQLSPSFVPAWVQLGFCESQPGGNISESKFGYDMALSLDGNNKDAMNALAKIYASQNSTDKKEIEKEIDNLTKLKSHCKITLFYHNRLGWLHYNRREYWLALKSWKAVPATEADEYNLFNIGLAYNSDEIEQRADAIDIWSLAESRFPESTRSRDFAKKAVITHAPVYKVVGRYPETLLQQKQWYANYVNPFELLTEPEDMSYAELGDYDAKSIQKLRQKLITTIKLEDGKLEWLPGLELDESKAHDICLQLSDEKVKSFHWYVYQNKGLLNFLTKGCHMHFVITTKSLNMEAIAALGDFDNGFLEWLSEPFSRQYDLVMSEALSTQATEVLMFMSEGRRWVASAYDDKCFISTRRLVDRSLDIIREFAKKSDEIKPTKKKIEAILHDNSLMFSINFLPLHFQDLRNELALLLRKISISCNNNHDDNDLALYITKAAQQVNKIPADIVTLLKDDRLAIEALIQKERAHEVKLARGTEKFEITKEGATVGSKHIASDRVSGIRWGILITRVQYGINYEYRLVCTSLEGAEVHFYWKVEIPNSMTAAESSKATNQGQDTFGKLVDAALRYLFPAVVKHTEEKLEKGLSVKVGPCEVRKEVIMFEKKGWLFGGIVTIPWSRVNVSIKNGDVTVSDKQSAKTAITFPLLETYNVSLFNYFAVVKNC